MVRVGVEDAIDDSLLADFTGDIQLIRISVDPAPEEFFEVDFWIPSHRIATARRQWTHLKDVKVVQSLLAGVDAIRGFVPPGAILCDARGVLDSPTAEMAVTLVLAAQKYLPFYVELQQHADWRGRSGAEQISLLTPGGSPDPNMPALIDEVEDKTILILGYGSIGHAIEARLAPFGPRFIRVARSAREGVEPVSNLDALLPQADILIIITPLTSETHHLINADRLALMKPGALLVNVGRGPIVDTAALLRALDEYKIRAAIDVTDPEPLPPEHPLWKAPNILITPHISTSSSKFLSRGYAFAAQQAQRYARGEPLLNIVTGEY
jgi:phosphoglycerate dehydrogenase-like enzyme